MKSPRISTHNGETIDDQNGKPDSPRRVAEEDEVLFFKQPHTLTALLFAGIILVYFAFYHTRAEENSAYNIKMGFLAMVLVFLFFSMQQMRDGLFVRPHPAFWRIVMGCAVLYLLGCVYMLFQTADDARRLFSFIDPALGMPLPERSYAEDCRIFTPENPESQYKNVMGTVYDEFLIAHLLGWFGKSLILRDAYLSWFISILFEVLELSLEHILPNFKECWWDHIILDVLVCNGIGIYLGHLVLQYLEVKEYDWGGRTNANKKRGRSVSNAKRMVLQFTPYNWTKFNWSIFESPKRFFAVIGFIALESVIELNCFFLKFVLWHPPPHPLVTARLFLWFLFALPATREYYEWISNPKCKRIGTMAWLALAITGTEVLIWVKFSKGQFDHVVSHPPAVVWSWAIFLIGLFSWAVFYFYYYKPRKQRQLQDKEQKKQE